MLKIKQLYRVLLITGILPLFLVIGGFSYWLIADSDTVKSVVMGIFIFTAGLLLINVVFLFLYYEKARKQNNPQALSRSLAFIGLLLSNVVVDVISYNYMNYASTTNTIVFENKTPNVVKKIFLSSGNEKYFIPPVEPKQSVSRALSFSSSGAVNYTFDLKGQTYSGLLIKDTVLSMGKKFKFVIYRNGRVVIRELTTQKLAQGTMNESVKGSAKEPTQGQAE